MIYNLFKKKEAICNIIQIATYFACIFAYQKQTYFTAYTHFNAFSFPAVPLPVAAVHHCLD